jgi:hypothetical protein
LFCLEQDHRQIENEYLIHQQSMLSRSAALNEMLSFKKELERSERNREQLADRLEVKLNFLEILRFISSKFSPQ